MSQDNVEVLRAQFDGFEHGGLDAVRRLWHPDIEWRAVEGAADDVGVIRGPEALRRYYQDWIDTLDQLSARVDEVILEAGEQIAVAVRNRGRGRVSGVPTEGRYYVVCTVRDGQIVRGREFATRAEALDAFAPDNVAVVTKQFADTNARDFAAVMDAYADDVTLELHGEKGGILARTATGKAAVGEWFGDWFRQFGSDYRFEIEESRSIGDHVFIVATHRGRGRDSGVPVEERWAYVYTVLDGRVSRVELWGDRDAREAALEAVEPGGPGSSGRPAVGP